MQLVHYEHKVEHDVDRWRGMEFSWAFAVHLHKNTDEGSLKGALSENPG